MTSVLCFQNLNLMYQVNFINEGHIKTLHKTNLSNNTTETNLEIFVFIMFKLQYILQHKHHNDEEQIPKLMHCFQTLS